MAGESSPGDVPAEGVIFSDWAQLSRRSSRIAEQPAEPPAPTPAPGPPTSKPPARRKTRSSIRPTKKQDVRDKRAKERAERERKAAAAKEAERLRRREQMLAARNGGGGGDGSSSSTRTRARKITHTGAAKRKADDAKDSEAEEDQAADDRKRGTQRGVAWYRRGFERFDADKDGLISFGDFAAVMNSIGHAKMSHRTLSMLFNKADAARTGAIDFSAFMVLMAQADSYETSLLERQRDKRKRRRRRAD